MYRNVSGRSANPREYGQRVHEMGLLALFRHTGLLVFHPSGRAERIRALRPGLDVYLRPVLLAR